MAKLKEIKAFLEEILMQENDDSGEEMRLFLSGLNKIKIPFILEQSD